MKKTGIYQDVSVYDFEQAFKQCGRQDQFTYAGKKALFDYLEQLSEDTGEPIELDVIALCCEYTEYDSFEDLQKDYPDIEDRDDLNEHTAVIPIDVDSFIIQQF